MRFIVGTRRLIVTALAATVRADAACALAVVRAVCAALAWIGARTRRRAVVRAAAAMLRGYHAAVHPRWIAAAYRLRAWA